MPRTSSRPRIAMRLTALCVLAACLAPATLAASITWTGIVGDNQWTNPVNWSPDTVPTMNDDVTIPNGTVYITIPTGVNSLVMGNEFNSPAYVTIYNAFAVGQGGLQVQGNGFLYLSAGASALTGPVTVDGSLIFSSGTLSNAQVTIGARGTADFSSAAEKTFADGTTVTASGSSFLVGGVLSFTQPSVLTVTTVIDFTTRSTLVQGPSGSLDLSAASMQCSTPITMMTSATFGPTNVSNGCVVNVQAGNVTFAQALAIPSGASIETSGVGNILVGAGVSGSGSLNVAGGTMVIQGSSASSVATVTVDGGNLVVSGPSISAANVDLLSGTVATPGSGSVVSAVEVSIATGGITLNGVVSASSSATLSGVITFGAKGSLVVSSSATLTTSAVTTLTGNPGPSVTVAGVLNATKSITFNNIGLLGGGVVNIGSGAVVNVVQGPIAQQAVYLASGAVFKGDYSTINGLSKVVPAGSMVKGTIGAYSFTCPGQCNRLSTTKEPTSSFTFVSAP